MAEKPTLEKFIVGVILIGIILVIGIFIASSMGDTFNNSTLASGSAANETGYVNSTGYNLSDYSSNNFVLSSIVVLNATDNSTWASNLYTVTNGLITNATVATLDSALISYEYTTGTANTDVAANASDDLVTALSGGSAWITILVVVGFATIVLGMLTAGLKKSKYGEEGPIY